MRKSSMLRLVAIAVAVAVGAIFAASTQARFAGADEGVAGPTIVLVHGAWEQASSWSAVAEQLRARGYRVLAPDLPLRTLGDDAAAVARIVKAITGPKVLVGHSYGGAVISNVASDDVKALVYIAAFAPDRGESTFGLGVRAPGSLVGASLVPVPFVGPDGAVGSDLYVNPLLYPSVFAQDVSAPTAATMARTQRPLTLAALLEQSAAPAWRTITSWYMVAGNDLAIPPATERFMAERAKATTVEIASSHAAQVSHPDAVTDLILAAARSASPLPAPVAAVTRLRLSPSTFRAARSGPSVRAAAVPTAARVSYAVNAPATVRFAAQRCVTPTTSNRQSRRCTRFVSVRGSFSRSRPAGGDRFTFTGRLGGRVLQPGHYRLVATPSGDGRTGKRTRALFRIVP